MPWYRARITRLIAAILLVAGMGLGVGPTSVVHAAPPVIAPGAPDTTVPLGPPTVVRRGGQTIQARAIRTTRTASGREVIADRIIVGFKPGVTDAERDAVHRGADRRQPGVAHTPLKQVGQNAHYVDVTGAPSLEAAIQVYLADPRVRYAEPDDVIHTAEVPNDPSFGVQYGMTKIQAPTAWNTTHGSASVKIAILDCGIYEAHPDLAGKVVARQDFTGDVANSPTDPATNDRCNHGTHVAGIASADTNNSVGVAGVGYTTSLLNGKVLLEQYDGSGNLIGGSGSTTWIAGGIRWAADNGANVINMSLGARAACEQTFQDAITYAWGKNVVIAAAAGNDGLNEAFEPADCTHVVAVASTDSADARSSFSNFGGWVSVAAPGSSIYSTVNPNIAENQGASYAYFDGTSMATPHVAGLAGLLWATGWGTSAQGVVSRLENTADQIAGTGTYWQFGRINAASAVGSSASGSSPTIASLSPAAVVAGSGAFTLTVNGANFQAGAAVLWNNQPLPTTVVSTSQLTAAVSAGMVASPGHASVVVRNPGGSSTAPADFVIFATMAGPTAGAASLNGRLYVFVRGTDNRLYVTSTADRTSFAPYAYIGPSNITATPAAATVGNTLYVVVRGSDNQIYVTSTTDGAHYSGFHLAGPGQVTASPAATSLGGSLFIFVRGTDSNIYLNSTTDGVTFAGYRSFGAAALNAAPAATTVNGQMVIAALGTDNIIYLNSTADGVNFSGYRSAGGRLTSAPAVAAVGGTLYVGGLGTDNNLYLNRSNDGGYTFLGWQTLGGGVTAGPTLAALGTGTLAVIERGLDGQAWMTTTTNGISFTGWAATGGITPPSAQGGDAATTAGAGGELSRSPANARAASPPGSADAGAAHGALPGRPTRATPAELPGGDARGKGMPAGPLEAKPAGSSPLQIHA